jgi:hypothetical protein
MAVNWKGPPETTHSVPRELEARLLMSVEGAWIGGAGHAFSMLATPRLLEAGRWSIATLRWARDRSGSFMLLAARTSKNALPRPLRIGAQLALPWKPQELSWKRSSVLFLRATFRMPARTYNRWSRMRRSFCNGHGLRRHSRRPALL